MIIRKARRKQAKIKLGCSGPSGSGKTYSSILLAEGLVGDLGKVCLIDSERGAADLYEHLGDYLVINLTDHKVDTYIKAIDTAVRHGVELIVIDTVSAAWEYITHLSNTMSGNSFQNWAKLMPYYRKLINKVLSIDAHVILNFRSKTDYLVTEKATGKMKVEKVGLKPICKDDIEYELSLFFNLDMNHNASVSKNRTSLFDDDPVFILDQSIGKKIRSWCNTKPSVIRKVRDISDRISSVKSLQELIKLYELEKPTDESIKALFVERKAEFISEQDTSEKAA